MGRQVEHRPPLRPGEPPLEIVRSTRRRRGASAFVRDGRVVVQVPAHLATADAERAIAALVARVTRRDRAERRGGDDWLAERARLVGDRWLGGIRARSVTWSDRMTRRWASATPSTGAIRVSDVAAAFPDRVVDYLLVHELAHLQVPDHSAGFHRLVEAYPEAAWARGFLAGFAHAAAAGTAQAPTGPPGSSPDSSPDSSPGSS